MEFIEANKPLSQNYGISDEIKIDHQSGNITPEMEAQQLKEKFISLENENQKLKLEITRLRDEKVSIYLSLRLF
jgi:regulator of replication initiation timing